MKKTQEQKFLQVKEQLDYFRLPTVFPIQATDTIYKVLSLVPRQRGAGKQNNSSKNNACSTQLNDAIRLQISKTVKQNNRLHSQLMNTRQQNQALKHSIEKHTINRMGGHKQSLLLIEASKKREQQLFQQLTQIKYKYNQLMDLVHQDPNIQKQYLKRLVKHKHYQIPYNLQAGSNPQHSAQRNQKQKRKIGEHESVCDLQHKVLMMQQKIDNREAEIMRLHKKVQYDGLNMNKILKDFEADRNQQKISGLQQQLSYLQEQNKKMKDQVSSVRKKGGLKQALREQTRKNHATIKNISSANKQLNTKMQEKDYDLAAREKQMQREVKQAQQQCKLVNDNYQLAQLTIEDLQKKVQFLKQQLQSVKNQLQKQENGNINKQIMIDQMKNSQEGGKILCQYQIEDLKKKLNATESLLSDYQDKITKLSSDNKYLQQQGLLKSQAIENLQKIVDELMRRDSAHKNASDLTAIQSQTPSLQNALAMKRDLSEMRHVLSITKNENMRLEQQFDKIKLRYDQKMRQNAGFSEEISRLKSKIYQVKRLQGDHFETDKIIENLRIQLRKQQTYRNKIEAMHQEIELENASLKRQLKQTGQQYQVYERKAKNHLNSVNNEKVDIAESNHLLEIRIKDKDRKLCLYEQKMEQLQNKVNILRDQVNLLQDEKHSLVREKHRAQKRYEQTMRTLEQSKGKDLQSMSITENEVTRYKKQVSQLSCRIQNQAEELRDLKESCDRLHKQKQAIINEKTSLLRENDSLKMQCNTLERRIISKDPN